MPELELKVRKIRNGSVIDHVRAGYGLSVLKILGITKNNTEPVAVAMHVKSPKINQTKDIVKVENRELKEHEVNKLALIAPKATINIIREYEVVEKMEVHLPDKIYDLIKCINPACITNTNEPTKPVFTIISKEPIKLKCNYCKKDIEEDAILGQF